MISLRLGVAALLLAGCTPVPAAQPVVIVSQAQPGPTEPVPGEAAPAAATRAGVELPTPTTPPPERDDRFRGRPMKSRALLVTELQGLEALFSTTSAASPDRPALMNRLALGYAELERRAEADRAGDPKAGKMNGPTTARGRAT
jgi:hypothetical protein